MLMLLNSVIIRADIEGQFFICVGTLFYLMAANATFSSMAVVRFTTFLLFLFQNFLLLLSLHLSLFSSSSCLADEFWLFVCCFLEPGLSA